MIPTNEVEQGTTMTVAEFYDALAPDYDTMTGFEKRFVHEKPFFRLLTEKHGIHKAIDAGCGTGFHALLLAQLGVQTTGVDVSPAMILKAQRHAKELSLPVKFIEARNQDLWQSSDSQFDAVFSLGNTAAHVSSNDELLATFESYRKILKPKGILFLQNLNYDRILAHKERVQSIKEIDGTTFVRFYDYADQFITFNILTIVREGGLLQRSIRTVQLLPLQSNCIVEHLLSSGFDGIGLYGDIAMNDYDPKFSKDFVVIAEKKDNL